MKIVIGYNTSHYAYIFRSNLIKKLIQKGHEVVVFSPLDKYSKDIESIGAKHINIPIKMDKNPFSDIFILINFYKLLKKEKPTIYLGYTIKPNIYGSIAAQLLNIHTINNIAGLGATFIKNGLTTTIVKFLYRIALQRSNTIFFQNKDDLSLFLEEKIISHKRYDLLPGSGVDLEKYKPSSTTKPNECMNLNFLLIARMLWDKGIGEYVDAARDLKKKNKQLRFFLLGPLDVQNPAAISREKVNQWQKEGVIEYLGFSEDPRKEIVTADCIVLPSYREGTPRTLLEAAAMGKPLITTNAVGCKEVVDHEINGFLCNARDSKDLAEKMLRMAQTSIDQRLLMGKNSRIKVENQFSEEIVLKKYIDLISTLTMTTPLANKS